VVAAAPGSVVSREGRCCVGSLCRWLRRVRRTNSPLGESRPRQRPPGPATAVDGLDPGPLFAGRPRRNRRAS